MKKLDFSVLIVTYNSNRFLPHCISSIFCQDILPREIYVVDNNSKAKPSAVVEELKATARKKGVKVSYLENKENLGYARAVNLAIPRLSGSWVLVLNPDVRIGKTALSQVFKFLKNREEKILAIGGKAFSWGTKKVVPNIAKKPNFLTLLFEFTSLKKIFPSFFLSNSFWDKRIFEANDPFPADMISGSFIFLNKKNFLFLGGFDENFFLYLEDLDLGMRARSGGYELYCLPSVTMEHYGGGSSAYEKGKISQQAWDYSKRYFSKKWFSWRGSVLVFIFGLDDLLIKIKKLLGKIVAK